MYFVFKECFLAVLEKHVKKEEGHAIGMNEGSEGGQHVRKARSQSKEGSWIEIRHERRQCRAKASM